MNPNLPRQKVVKMINAESLIPEISDQDIEWVQCFMELDSFDGPRHAFLKHLSTVDLSACPGSGKTTLIVAKLAILAKKWPHRTKGICVLSHTNVAREQIEHRLGRTGVGQRLLAYPHFIGTIHGFVNRFLALPWLYSNGYPSPTIDDDVTTRYRCRVLGRDCHKLEFFLKKNRTSFERLRICNRNLSFDLGGKPFPAKSSTPSFKNAKRAIETAAKAGYFCHDEMFIWANALLEDHPGFSNWLAHRFPLVIVDEMQDTSKRQASFLDEVFPRTSNKIVVQRVGDPNQKIFNLSDVDSGCSNFYPDPKCNLSIPNSYRFGNDIAKLASPFAVQRVGTKGLSGISPRKLGATGKECKHAIFVFPDDNTDGVLDAFGKHVLDQLGDALATKGTVHAVGHVHKDNSNVSPKQEHYPKLVGHYWDAYTVELSSKDPHPRTLVQYVRVAQGLVASGRTLSPGVEKIASGTIELARRLGDIGDLKRKARTHRAVTEALEGDAASLTTYQNLQQYFLVERVTLSKDGWRLLAKDMTAVAAALCSGDTDASKVEQFLAWGNPSLGAGFAESGNVEPNVLCVTNGDNTVKIRLGTIHSVKGQTHLATLLLSTYWYASSAKQMMPWLLGQKVNGKRANKRDTQRLLHTYVAMTRPRHLLCLAIPRSALGKANTMVQAFATLRARGWHIAEIVENEVSWRN